MASFRYALVYVPFDSLPTEIFSQIFGLLDVRALVRAACVSKVSLVKLIQSAKD